MLIHNFYAQVFSQSVSPRENSNLICEFSHNFNLVSTFLTLKIKNQFGKVLRNIFSFEKSFKKVKNWELVTEVYIFKKKCYM